MRITAQILSQSDCTNGKNPIVVEGYQPELIPYLSEYDFVVFQNSEEDHKEFFTTEESVLNVLKPKIYIVDSPSPFDVELCKSFGCEIESTQSFISKQLLWKGMKRQVEDDGYRKTLEESIADMSSLPPNENPSFMLDVEEASLPKIDENPNLNSLLSEGAEHDN